MRQMAISTTLVVGLVLSMTLGTRDVAALEAFVANVACPVQGQSKGKFVGQAVETRLVPPGPIFQGTVEAELTFCDVPQGITKSSITFIFGTTSTANNVVLNNFGGIPAPFILGQPSFTYMVGPVLKTVTAVTGAYTLRADF